MPVSLITDEVSYLMGTLMTPEQPILFISFLPLFFWVVLDKE